MKLRKIVSFKKITILTVCIVFLLLIAVYTASTHDVDVFEFLQTDGTYGKTYPFGTAATLIFFLSFHHFFLPKGIVLVRAFFEKKNEIKRLIPTNERKEVLQIPFILDYMRNCALLGFVYVFSILYYGAWGMLSFLYPAIIILIIFTIPSSSFKKIHNISITYVLTITDWPNMRVEMKTPTFYHSILFPKGKLYFLIAVAVSFILGFIQGAITGF